MPTDVCWLEVAVQCAPGKRFHELLLNSTNQHNKQAQLWQVNRRQSRGVGRWAQHIVDARMATRSMLFPSYCRRG